MSQIAESDMKASGGNRRRFLQQVAWAGATSLAVNGGVRGDDRAKSATPTLKEAMIRAGDCCLAWLDPKHDFLPTGGYEVAHDTGRWWDAMLRLEDATGFALGAAVESAMLRNLHRLADNAVGLLVNGPWMQVPGQKVRVNPHNLRESMLAFNALVRHRRSAWAQEQGHRLVAAIDQLLDADGQMDYCRLAAKIGVPLSTDLLMVQRAPAGQWFNATATTGRALEAIVWFHEATGDLLAKQVARRLAEIHLDKTVQPDGRVRPELLDPSRVGHTHSYLGTLRGLLLFGFMSGDKRYVDAVARTYRRGLFGTVISHSGWTPHDQGKCRFPDKEGDPIGEHASCGDVVQLALWLGLRAGHTDLLDDVERLIRARLLPSQITGEKNPRRNGAWGVYGHPFGRGAILDVFAAVLHSLADVSRQIVTRKARDSVSVNLHFDAETPWAVVKATRAERGRLRIALKQPVELRIRVPGWAPRNTLQLAVSRRRLPLRWEGDYLCVSAADASGGAAVELDYDVPRGETVEVMPVSGRRFRLTWRGDEVVACEPRVPIYAPL